jgi:hypothetical protein
MARSRERLKSKKTTKTSKIRTKKRNRITRTTRIRENNKAIIKTKPRRESNRTSQPQSPTKRQAP